MTTGFPWRSSVKTTTRSWATPVTTVLIQVPLIRRFRRSVSTWEVLSQRSKLQARNSRRNWRNVEPKTSSIRSYRCCLKCRRLRFWSLQSWTVLWSCLSCRSPPKIPLRRNLATSWERPLEVSPESTSSCVITCTTGCPASSTAPSCRTYSSM